MAVDGVTGTKTATDTPSKTSKTLEDDGMGRDAFLQLLVTKLKNQDPTNPATDTEFLGQLAQFSSLEQLTSINAAVTSLAARMDSLEAMGASKTTSSNERKA
ncbi:MAG: hypothetical protein HOP16_00380 [Acidobacteria bacterium]|nr:hypothetical protein [Acidobacteriota bacterium]